MRFITQPQPFHPSAGRIEKTVDEPPAAKRRMRRSPHATISGRIVDAISIHERPRNWKTDTTYWAGTEFVLTDLHRGRVCRRIAYSPGQQKCRPLFRY
jgi:hypothetical protein